VSALRSLERFARSARRAREGARCELCAASVGAPHRHVVDLADRRLLCACDACALVFTGGAPARYRAVPRAVRSDPGFTLAAADLERLGVPVGLAFFFRPSRLGRWTAVFPGPAGATEAELADDAWAALAARSELLRTIEDDVEALLVRRRPNVAESATLVVPIDVCYELTALLKRHWRGFDGGDEARAALDAFFAELASRSAAHPRGDAA
jgi:hypothetical protein